MKLLKRFFLLIRFCFFYLKELLMSNLTLARDILSPSFRFKPGVIAIRMRNETAIGRLVLTNLITMTPGTLSLDVSDDGKTLFVHCLYLQDVENTRRSLEDQYEALILEIFG